MIKFVHIKGDDAYRAIGAQHIYWAQRDGKRWQVSVHNRVDFRELTLTAPGQALDTEWFDRLSECKTYAQHYEANVDHESRRYLNRSTRAVLATME